MKTLIITLSIFLTLFTSSCFFNPGMQGSGNVVTDERELGSFHSIDYSGQGHLHITQGKSGAVRIEAEDNVLEVMETRISNGVLKIKFDKRLGKIKPIHIYLSAPDFESIEMSGATKLISESKIVGDKLEISISGAGEIDCNLDFEELNTQISGAGEANLTGSVGEHNFSVSGAGELNAYGLRTRDTHIDISGAGEAKVTVEGELDASISGAGSVRYKGEPEVINKSVSGAGSVKAAS